MLRLVVLFAGLLAVQGQTTNVQRCTGRAAQNAPLPINAYVEGCINPPCQLPVGTFATVHLVFKAPRTMTRMTTRAQAFLIFAIDYPLGEFAETCNFLNNSFCPVMKDEVLEYTLQMKIEEAFPVGVSPHVEFRIEDDANEPITCIRVRIMVAPPLPQLTAA
ncbi:hypothetical protein ABMA28_008932 [Loxostege sticticalis]|uniref:MD-2-related lipid-recognition domain-containing protein n=1 Tax=Loxostege sticticalis TaxID=481309 RepID=A0ABD0SFV0_LOXSC